jgi:hypothetical protein
VERRHDVFRRDAADGEPDVIQHVVARLHRLIDEIEPDASPDSPEVHDRGEFVDFGDQSRNAKTHTVPP